MSAIGKAMRARRASRGFTLIETLVVLAVTGLIAGLSFASIEKLSTFWTLRAAYLSVDSALGRARARALSGADPVDFRVSAAEGRYGVTGETVQTLPGAVAFLPGTASVRFYPDGTASGGRVGLKAGARQSWFSISADTGLIGVAQ